MNSKNTNGSRNIRAPASRISTARGEPIFCLDFARRPWSHSFPAPITCGPSRWRTWFEIFDRRQVRVVTWCPDLAVATRADDHLGPLRVYLRDHYHPAGSQGQIDGS